VIVHPRIFIAPENYRYHAASLWRSGFSPFLLSQTLSSARHPDPGPGNALLVAFLTELPRFENSRNVEMTADQSLAISRPPNRKLE
jgi:hypothetical protein